MKKISATLLFCLLVIVSNAQDKEKRHSFARSYYGIDFNIVPAYGTSQFIDNDGNTIDFERSAYINPSINIGATHFWGYADFYVSITTGNIKLSSGDDDETIDHDTRFGTFTGTRIYPMPLNNNQLRPFVGYKFSPFRYLQTDNNELSTKVTQVKSVFDIGLSYRTPQLYAYLGYNWVANSDVNLFISETDQITTTVPSGFFNLGVNYMIETTRGTNNPTNNHFNEVFGKSNKDGLFFGIGPSAAFPTKDSEYISDLYPYLDDRSMPIIFPDLAVGYHFTKTNLMTALSFRPVIQTRNAQNFSQRINRNSFVLETYKVLGDYHGFAPYLGVGVSYEAMRLREELQGINITDISQNKATPIITTGWDIRPSDNGDFWVLRTNLRYAPFLTLEHNDKALSLQHLEFNFIQFVYYPQRKKAFNNYKK